MNKNIHEIQSIGKQLSDKKMLLGCSGNISVYDHNAIYITGSGTYLNALLESDISICQMNGTYEGIKPSKEFILHQVIYKQRPDIMCVIHCSPYYTTCMCCTDMSLKTNVFVESMYYLKHLKRIPYAHPGSDQLKNYVLDVCKDTNVILMENHGVLVYGKSIQEAMTTLDVLEYCCRMNLQCHSQLQEVANKGINDFTYKSGY